MKTLDYLALDFGAESGRGVLGRFNGETLALEETHRFLNEPTRMRGTLYWDLPRLFHEAKHAIRKAGLTTRELDGVGVDTWGVDFGLIARDDVPLGNPVHYRDARTERIADIAFKLIPRERVYEITGLQFLPFNTVFQLLSMRCANSPLLDIAETFLMIPDLFGWLLSGRRGVERTNASTTQLYNPVTRNWSDEICVGLGIPRSILPELIEPGTVLGPLDRMIADETGVQNLSVIAPATHDTASAVVAAPAISTSYSQSNRSSSNPDWCYLSSGTWSLLGVEVPSPIINKQTLEDNFTNEGGIDGTTRLLKNIMGLWIIQECRRAWAKVGYDLTYDDLMIQAANSPAFGSLIDPDHASFLPPGDMPGRIASYCRATNQPVPMDFGAVARCVLESLALKYRRVIERLEVVLGNRIRTIHVVGGGSKNTLLCQLTADACDRIVHAGPVEATAAGNILMQLRARGRIQTLEDARNVVVRSFPMVNYVPLEPVRWRDAIGRFEELINRPMNVG